MEQSQKKDWKTPELIVLVRSNSEEAVLSACKNAGGTRGPSAGNCDKPAPGCSVIAPS